MKKFLPFVKTATSAVALLLLATLGQKSFGQTVVPFTTPGLQTWQAPVGVTTITVECWGGGGAGAGVTGTRSSGGGGKGGGYVKSITIPVTPGTTYNLTVGAGGTGSTGTGTNGGPSWFNTTGTILAVGGDGAAGVTGNTTAGTGATAINPTTGNVGGTITSVNGGNGGSGTTNFGTVNGSGAGGGGGGGTAGNGTTGGTGANGGGNGAAGVTTSNSNGNSAVALGVGGGGSGAFTNGTGTDENGGAGGNGKVVITYTAAPALSATALTAFSTPVCINSTVGPNSFTITGTNLTTANVTVAALPGFTYSTTSNGAYSTSLALSHAAGSYSQQIWVEFTPTAVQPYSGNIVVGGGGATAVNVAASGSGINTAPTSTSGTATAVAGISATVAGSFAAGCATVSSYGIEYSTTSGFTPGTGTDVASTNQVTGNYTSALTGLTPGTQYFYVSYAVTSAGTVYGTQGTFTTATPSLSVTGSPAFGTNNCLNVTTSALSFTVTGTNLTTAPITVGPLAGFTYSTTVGGAYQTSLSLAQPGGAYSQQIFVEFTPTAIQAYDGTAPVGGGGSAGTTVSITGSGVNTAPIVTSGSPSLITGISAAIAGSFTAGCSSTGTYGIEYSTSPFTPGTGTPVNGTGGASFTANLTGLAQNTTYFYDAYYIDGGATAFAPVYGTQLSFTTSSGSLSVTGSPAFGTNNCLNVMNGPQSFTITGSNLSTDPITVGPLAGFAYSTTAGGTYTASLSLTQPGGSYSQQVFVEFTPTAVQAYDGTAPVAGGGATATSVSITGSGVNTAPTAASGVASSVTGISATVAGSFAAGCSTTGTYGIEYSTSPFTPGTGTPVNGTGGASFTANLTGLTQNTTYYYDAYYIDGGATAFAPVYGTQLSFVTSSGSLNVTGAPAFGTNNCLNVMTGPQSFTITGTNLSTDPVTVGPLAGFAYSTTAGGTYTASLSLTQPGGSYSQQIFVEFTPTAVQVYDGTAPIAGGGASGATVSITGSGVNTAPTATTGTASSITGIAATVAGSFTAGCSTTGTYGIEYSTSPFTPGSGTAVNGTGGASFTSSLTGLSPSTTYYYDAYYIDGGATVFAPVYGAQLSFTTATPSLSVTGSPAFGTNNCLNVTTSAQSFTINGTNLTTDPVTVGPLAGFAYSTTAGGTYTASLSLTQSGAATYTQQVFVKFTPTVAQVYDGSAPVAGGGATATSVSITGSGTNPAPTISGTTVPAATITGISAVVNVTGAAASCSATTAYGVEYSLTTGFPNGTGIQVAGTGLTGGNFTANITGLLPGTTYFYHAFETNSGGTTYSIEGSFTTKTPALSVSAITTTVSFSNICINTTVGPDNFTITGTNLSTANVTIGPLAGFTYSTTSGGTYTASLSLAQAGGSYSQQIFVKFLPTLVQSYSGTIPVGGGGATTVNESVTATGVNPAPTISVTTVPAATITGISAVVNVTGAAGTCNATTAYGVEYSLTTGFPNGTGIQVAGTGLAGGNFTATLTGLAPNTTYFYHAFETNSGGTTYSAQGSFTTKTPALSVSAITTTVSFSNVCINTTVGPDNFTITGTNLSTANVTIGPLAGFTYSTTSAGTYTASLSLAQAGGSYSQQIFVKFTPTLVQSYSGTIPVGGGGATTVNESVTASGVNNPPSITAATAGTLTGSSAIITVTGTAGCTAITAFGAEYSTTTGFANGTGTQVAGTGLAGGNFTANITGLLPGTTYFYHAFATNSGGTTYSAQGSFTTSGASITLTPATLTSYGAQCIGGTYTGNSFTITGSVSPGNVTVAALAGYMYATSLGGPYSSTLTISQSGGSINQTIFVEFSPIVVQAYPGTIAVGAPGATSKNETISGNSGVNTPPTVTAGAATGITSTTATLPGTITAAGCTSVTAYGVEYSTTAGFANGSGTQIAATNLAGSNFSVGLTGLVQGQTYYYHSYATNGGGTGFSAQGSFTTVCGALNVPYFENFDEVTSPALPNCSIVVNTDGSNTWTTSSLSSASFPNALRYSPNTNTGANDWWITPGINVVSGSNYLITFSYADTFQFNAAPQSLEVRVGTSQTSASLTAGTQLFSNTAIGNVNFKTVTVPYTATATGIVYFGWHCNAANHGGSTANDALVVDDISIVARPTDYNSIFQAVANNDNGTGMGDWSDPATWQSKPNAAATFAAASSAPTSLAQSITIPSGINVTVTTSVTSSVLNVAGYIEIDPLIPGTDAGGSITATGATTVSGTYNHARNGGSIPTATWANNSLLEITGIVDDFGATGTGNGTNDGSMNFHQSYYDLTWNCPNQILNAQGTTSFTWVNNVPTVRDNLTIASTGVGFLRISGNEANTLNISNSFIMTGGTFSVNDLVTTTANPSATNTMNVTGNVQLLGGIFQPNGSGSAIDTVHQVINVGGNWVVSGGSYVGSYERVTFNGTHNQIITGTNPITDRTIFGNLTISTVGGSTTLNINSGLGTQQTNATTLTVSSGSTFDLSTFACNSASSVNTPTMLIPGTLRLGGNTGGQTGSNFPTGFIHNTLTSGTVEYYFSGAQTVYNVPSSTGTPYNNLTISTAGVKTITGNLQLLTGNITVNPAATFDLKTFTANHATSPATSKLTVSATGLLRLGGTTGGQAGSNFPTNFSGANTVLNSTGTVEYYGNNGSTQTVYAPVTYGNLTLTNYSGTGTASKNITANVTGISGNLTINDSTLFDMVTFTGNGTSAGTMNINGAGYLKLSGTTGGVSGSNFPNSFSSYVFTPASTTEYYGTSAQTAAPIGTPGYGNLTVTNASIKTAGGPLNIQSNMLINPTATFAGNLYSHSVGGNWTNNGAFTAGASTVIFNGSGSLAQIVGGSTASTFFNLSIASAAGGPGVTFIDANKLNKTVNSALTLTSGLLTTDSVDMLVLASGATATVAAGNNLAINTNYYTSSSYVNGPMQWTVGTDASVNYTFPVGKKGIGYMPISMSGISGGTPQVYGAEYYHTSAETFGPVAPANPQLIHVSGCDYWRLELMPSGTTFAQSVSGNANTSLPSGTTNITMYWNPNSSGAPCINTGSTSVPFSQYVSNTNDLAIGHLQFVSGQSYAGLWYPEAPSSSAYAYGGTLANGSISYVGATTFSPFSLATINGGDNPLAIKLDYFTAVKANGYNKLTWKAECTSSSSSFIAERSYDGANFAGIDSVIVNNASDCSVPFTYDDYTSSGPKVYYRIKTVDISGNISYSEIRLILNNANTFELMSIKPNPVQGEAWLEVSASQSDKIELVLYSVDGRELQRKTVQVQAGSSTINMETAGLAKGMYIIRGIFSGGQTNTIPFIKQ